MRVLVILNIDFITGLSLTWLLSQKTTLPSSESSQSAATFDNIIHNISIDFYIDFYLILLIVPWEDRLSNNPEIYVIVFFKLIDQKYPKLGI